MKIIHAPLGRIPDNTQSHNYGYALTWHQRLEESKIVPDITCILNSEIDTIYACQDASYIDRINFFGGVSNTNRNNLYRYVYMSKLNTEIYSLDHDFSEIIDILITRKDIQEWLQHTSINQEDLEELKTKVTTLQMQDLGFKEIIFGDSHTMAYSLPHQAIHRFDGMTLYSMIKDDAQPLIDRLRPAIDGIKKITLCLGSIDIRHHILRKENYIAPEEFVEMYAKGLRAAEDELKVKITACAPVPVEYERRKLPKTGQYKKSNFYGHRNARHDYTMKFIDALIYHDILSIMPPVHWYEMDPYVYAQSIMEPVSSVHIGAHSYNSVVHWQ